MAWRRTGDKPLSEPMMAYVADEYMRHSVSMRWCNIKWRTQSITNNQNVLPLTTTYTPRIHNQAHIISEKANRDCVLAKHLHAKCNDNNNDDGVISKILSHGICSTCYVRSLVVTNPYQNNRIMHLWNMTIMKYVEYSIKYMHNLWMHIWIDVDVLIFVGMEIQVSASRTAILLVFQLASILMGQRRTGTRQFFFTWPCKFRFRENEINKIN